ncbi:MAG: ABC transporter permease [Xanthomonadales bacterium]|nr:ABC transporter permease [Xanthomonadales bacterium]
MSRAASLSRARQYSQLALYKVYAELREEVSRHYIGIAWWVLDPILYMLVFYVVFGVLPIRNRPEEFVAFLLVGLVHWRWFQQSIQSAANSIIANRAVMQLVYVPKILFPVCSLMATAFKYLVILVLLLIYLWSSSLLPSAAYLYLPLLMGTQMLLILSLALFAAAVVPLIPDLLFLIQHGLRMMFFVSGIFFAGAQLAPEHQEIFYLNPMARIIEGYRDVMLDASAPELAPLLMISAVSAVAAALGILLLVRMDRSFPKLVADK